MNRCNYRLTATPSAARRLLMVAAMSCAAGLSLQAAAQGLPADVPRNFPPTAQFAEMVITNFPEVTLNGHPVLTAPGFRLFSPERTLVFASNFQGQRFPAAFVIEPSTQWLQTAWVLTPAEIEKHSPVKPSWWRRIIGQ